MSSTWPTTLFPHASLDAAGLLALADLTIIAQRTALTGTASLLDSFVLCPGIHRQQDACELNRGELPPTAALTTGYVFRVENQATSWYLKRMGHTGHLVTMHVREIRSPKLIERISNHLFHPTKRTLAMILYTTCYLLTAVSIAVMAKLQDWWGLAVLLLLIIARLLNIIVVQQRVVMMWKGVSEPGVNGDLLVLHSQDRWLRLQGPVDCLKAVTAGQWMRDPNFKESSAIAIATVLVYLDAAVASNATQTGKIVLIALLLLSAGLVGLANSLAQDLHMAKYSISQHGTARAYERRLDLAHELVEETGREDWAIRLGMIGKPRDDEVHGNLSPGKVML